MIKNLIIIALVVFVIHKTDVSLSDILDYIQIGIDKLQELVYSMKEKV